MARKTIELTPQQQSDLKALLDRGAQDLEAYLQNGLPSLDGYTDAEYIELVRLSERSCALLRDVGLMLAGLPREDELADQFGGVWGEHPDYPVCDWAYEVGKDDTRASYWQWVASAIEAAEHEREPEDRSEKTAHA